MKKIIRLTEGDLHRIVKESAKKIIREWSVPYGAGISDEEWLNSAETEEEYNERLNDLRNKQKFNGEDAMNYHPQRNRSTMMGDDFASSYAHDPFLSGDNHRNADKVTRMHRDRLGFN